jgi:hypothetical protein
MSDRIDSVQNFYKGAAPVVRKLASDSELRDDLRSIITSGQRVSAKLMAEAGENKAGSRLLDRQISEQVERVMDLLATASRFRIASEPTHWRRWAIAMGAAGGMIVVLLAPKTGPAVRGRIFSIVRRSDEQPESQQGEWAA